MATRLMFRSFKHKKRKVTIRWNCTSPNGPAKKVSIDLNSSGGTFEIDVVELE